jgi:quercetin dioxygenase-like cupin family protein
MNDVSVIRHSDLPFRTIEGDGASGLQLARLYQNPEHALTFQLARVEPGGISKRHQHDWEQINWVVSGKGRVDAGDETIEIGPGDCITIPGTLSHAISNNGDEPLLLVAVLGPGAP